MNKNGIFLIVALLSFAPAFANNAQPTECATASTEVRTTESAAQAATPATDALPKVEEQKAAESAQVPQPETGVQQPEMTQEEFEKLIGQLIEEEAKKKAAAATPVVETAKVEEQAPVVTPVAPEAQLPEAPAAK